MKKLISMLSMAAVSVAMMAIPVKPGVWKMVTLADGTQVRAELRGDEYMSYWQTEDGQRYVQQEGTQTYIKADLAQLQLNAAKMRQAAPLRKGRKKVDIGGDHPDFVGSKKGLIILAEFSDVKFQTGHDADFYSRVANEENFTSSEGHVGSIRDYFLAQSEGQFDLSFDVAGPYELKYEQAYYGKNTSYSKDVNVRTMVKEAVQAAAKELGDFSAYDWFDDGYVDQVFVIYAGRGEADGGGENTIWPHRSQLLSNLTLGGKKVNVYACANEMRSDTQINGIGPFCHEFSHCLGLPDLYDTSYSGNYGMSGWDLMDSGAYLGDTFRPCGYSGYERNYCGWKTPQYLTDDTSVTDMKGLEEGGEYYIIQNDNYSSEYYILENRTKTGWDTDLDGEGLLITYIDFNSSLWSYNEVNTLNGYLSNDHQRYTVFAADNSYSGSCGDDAYPYNRNNLFTNYSVPAQTLYHANTDGKYFMSKPITNITKASDGSISFDFANEVGKEDEPLPSGVFFRETFNYCNGDGGNDDEWNVTTANMSGLMTDNMDWTVSEGKGGNKCAIIGGASRKGEATTPEFTITEPAVVSFKAGYITSGAPSLTLAVAEGDATLSETSFTMTGRQWSEFTSNLTATSYPATVKLTFANTRRRFFLDEVYVTTKSATGIKTIASDTDASAASSIYTIDGRHVGNDASMLKPGLYIKGGKKLVVK